MLVEPGTKIPITQLDSESFQIGNGLIQEDDCILVCKEGTLEKRKDTWFIDNHQKRYVAVQGDHVIGKVVGKLGDAVTVHIGTHQNAILSLFSFEGATKRNRPNISIGELVYAKITLADLHMETELTCVNAVTNKADGYGVLKGGFMIKVSLEVARRLLTLDSLKELGNQFPFELAVGMNGRVWVKADSIEHTLRVVHEIEKYDE